MKIINIIVLLLLLVCSTNSFAAWSRVGGVEAGAIGSHGSPTVQFIYEFTATVENTIDTLTLPTTGGCITWLYLDFLTPTPDSITTTVKNSLALTVTGPTTDALTADGILYQPNTGNPLCLAKGFTYAFTGTITVGDKFRVITEAMVND